MTLKKGELDAYQRLSERRPESFKVDEKGTLILLGEEERRAAEASIAKRLIDEGHPRSWSEAGLFYEDPWIWLVRDVVRFPDGEFGTHSKILHKGGRRGVIIVPIYGEKIVMINHFRHGTGDWSLEIPRGAPDSRLAIAALAETELREEIDAESVRVTEVGVLSPNNGMVDCKMHVFVAWLKSVGSPNRGEGIDSMREVTLGELKQLIIEGVITDSHSIAAITLAQLSGAMPGFRA